MKKLWIANLLIMGSLIFGSVNFAYSHGHGIDDVLSERSSKWIPVTHAPDGTEFGYGEIPAKVLSYLKEYDVIAHYWVVGSDRKTVLIFWLQHIRNPKQIAWAEMSDAVFNGKHYLSLKRLFKVNNTNHRVEKTFDVNTGA